jgi:anti-sigma factor RsiW
MNNPVHDELIRLSLKRELTEEDRARVDAALAAHPELREQWENDAVLGRMLRQLPDAPVSSNFTARVLDAIDLDARRDARAQRKPGWRDHLRALQPRLGWGVGLAALIAFGTHQYRMQQAGRAQAEIEQAQLVYDIRNLSQDFAALPGPEVFRDFEAINQFRQVSAGNDDELLKVLR